MAVPACAHERGAVKKADARDQVPIVSNPLRIPTKIAKIAGFVNFIKSHSVVSIQSQLSLVRTDGMQVYAVECRFIRNYLWFQGALVAIKSGRKNR